jgi:hypothetical protein
MTFAPAMTFVVEGVSRILRGDWDKERWCAPPKFSVSEV